MSEFPSIIWVSLIIAAAYVLVKYFKSREEEYPSIEADYDNETGQLSSLRINGYDDKITEVLATLNNQQPAKRDLDVTVHSDRPEAQKLADAISDQIRNFPGPSRPSEFKSI